ncbi:MAG TPA: hypothetical protein VGJ21_23440 [Terracidiphilus sp.]|jgi:hypothetical protein
MSAWPPSPDLKSIKELVRDADTEGFIAIHGAPADEYDGEAEQIFAVIGRWPTDQLNAQNLFPLIEKVWMKSFGYDDEVLAKTRPELLALAQQIARFFGPEATPRVRSSQI